MKERAPWLVAKDALWLRYDGPVPQWQATPCGETGFSAYWAGAAAQLRAGIARRRRGVAGLTVRTDGQLQRAAANLCRVRHATVAGMTGVGSTSG